MIDRFESRFQALCIASEFLDSEFTDHEGLIAAAEAIHNFLIKDEPVKAGGVVQMVKQ